MGGGAITSFLETKFFAFFGVLSYAIYITHAFCLEVINIVLRRVVAKFGLYVDAVRLEGTGYDTLVLGSSLTANIYVFLNLCIVVFVAYLAHRFIEKPFIKYGKKILQKS